MRNKTKHTSCAVASLPLGRSCTRCWSPSRLWRDAGTPLLSQCPPRECNRQTNPLPLSKHICKYMKHDNCVKMHAMTFY